MSVLQSCSFSVSMEAEDVEEVIDDNQNTDVCPSDPKDDSGSLPLPSMFNLFIEEENYLIIIFYLCDITQLLAVCCNIQL